MRKSVEHKDVESAKVSTDGDIGSDDHWKRSCFRPFEYDESKSMKMRGMQFTVKNHHA